MNMSATAQSQQLGRFKQLLRTDSKNARLRQQCVELALSLKDFDSVIEVADVTLAAAPDDAGARFDRATGLIGKREYRAALAVLETLHPSPSEAFGIEFNSALCHYCLEEYDQAVPKLEACYARGLRDNGLLRLLVTSYHHVGAMDEAVLVANENPDPAKTDATLAGAYALLFLDADDAARAAKWAVVTLRLNPKSIDGRVVQGTLLTARLNTAEAKSMLESVIQDAPTTARAWVGLGTLALLERDLPVARSLLERGVQLMPGHVGSWHMLGWTQLLQNDLASAETTFKHALDLDRNFAESHGGLASVAAIKGEREAAEHLIEVALRLDSECLSARFAQSVLAQRQGNATQARAIIDEAAAGLGAKQNSALGKLLQRARRS